MDIEGLKQLKKACKYFVENIDAWTEQEDRGMIKVALHDISQAMNEV